MLRVIQILILSLCLTTSSFSLNDYITERLTTGNYNQEQLQLALTINNIAAKYIVFNASTPGSLKWLNLAKFLARKDKKIAWQLALYYQQKHLDREQSYWAKHAYKLGATSAIIARAEQLATSRQHYQQAKRLLQAIDNEESHILQVNLAVKFADFPHLQTLVSKLISKKEQALLKALFAYQVLPSISDQNISSIKTIPRLGCRNGIQFFATNLADLNRLTALISQVQNSDFFSQQFCFKTPKYIAKQTIKCSHQDSERISCDVEPLAELLVDQGLNDEVKYIGILAPKGIANVDNGVVYIDKLDSHLVFEHELLHLTGFIDEYPLHILNSACEQNGALASNVVNLKRAIYLSEQDARAEILPLLPWNNLIEPNTPISHETPQGFRLGTPIEFSEHVGLFGANTCNNHQAQGYMSETFKPIFQVTQLQYFEEQLPLAYEKLATLTSGRFDMPSYHYNIGKKYKLRDDMEQANYWFEKATGVETSANIKFSLTKTQ